MAGLPPNFFDLCRTCKKPTPKDRKTVFNEEISAFFEKYPTLKSSDINEEKLPRVVCEPCFEAMEFVNKFVTRAERVKKELEHIVNDDSSNGQTSSTSVSSTQKLDPNPLKRKYPQSDDQNAKASTQHFNSPVTKTIKISSSLQELNHTTINYLICSSCKIIFHSVEDATIHKMSHNRVVHRCLVCSARFNTPSSLEKHVLDDCQSKEESTWTCSLCSFFHADWTQVKNHMKAEHKPCLECNVFWRHSLASANEKPTFSDTKLCIACGKLNIFNHEKDDILPAKSEDAGLALENEIFEVCEADSCAEPTALEVKQEIEEASENLSNADQVPYNDVKEVWVLLEKLSPDAIKRAMSGKKKDDLKTTKLKDCDEPGAAELGAVSHSPKKNDSILIVKLPSKKTNKKSNKVVPNNADKGMRCKYCNTNFTQQLLYIQHLRQYHL